YNNDLDRAVGVLDQALTRYRETGDRVGIYVAAYKLAEPRTMVGAYARLAAGQSAARGGQVAGVDRAAARVGGMVGIDASPRGAGLGGGIARRPSPGRSPDGSGSGDARAQRHRAVAELPRSSRTMRPCRNNRLDYRRARGRLGRRTSSARPASGAICGERRLSAEARCTAAR